MTKETYLGIVIDEAEERANRRGDDFPEDIAGQLAYWAEGRYREVEIEEELTEEEVEEE